MAKTQYDFSQIEIDIIEALDHSIMKPITVALGYKDETGTKILEVEEEDTDEQGRYYYHEIGGHSMAGEATLTPGTLLQDEIRYGFPIKIKKEVGSDDWVICGKHARLATEFMSGVETEQFALIEAKRINLGLIAQNEPDPDMQVIITEAAYSLDGVSFYVATGLSADFTADAAALSSGEGQFVLIQISGVDGVLDYIYGDIIDDVLTFANALVVDENSGVILPNPDIDHFRLGYVKLTSTTTQLVNDINIFPMQEFFTKSTGSGGGGSSAFNLEQLEVAFDDISPITIFTAAADMQVRNIYVNVTQAFDGTATLTVGDAGDNDRLVTAAQNDLATVGSYLVAVEYLYASSTVIRVYLATAGTTVGACNVTVETLQL